MYKLETFEERDIDQFISWFSDGRFLFVLSGPNYKMPLLREQLLSDIAAARKKEVDRRLFKVVDVEKNIVIGHIQLGRINYELRSAVIGKVLVGNAELRGKGIGFKMIKNLITIAFEEMELETIRLNVYDFNKQAIECYKKVGFTVEKIVEKVSI